MGGVVENLTGKGRSQHSNSSNTNLPPDWALPLFRKSAEDALKLYNSGKGGNVYQGRRVTDLSDQTKKSVNGLQDAANNYENGFLKKLLNSDSFSSQNLSDMASGRMLGNNQQFKEGLQNTMNEVASTVNSQMSGAGRYGSGANNKILAQTLGNIATKAQGDQYNNDVNDMMRANNLIDQSRKNQLDSANNFLRGESQNWLNALHGGNVLDKNNQDKLSEDQKKWSEEDNQGWNRLDLLKKAMRDAAAHYGTSVQQKNQTSSNGLGAIGGMLGKLIGK